LLARALKILEPALLGARGSRTAMIFPVVKKTVILALHFFKDERSMCKSAKVLDKI
jgi:hypothetical protein